eukprot:2541818-Prymnesium_polylepis.1
MSIVLGLALVCAGAQHDQDLREADPRERGAPPIDRPAALAALLAVRAAPRHISESRMGRHPTSHLTTHRCASTGRVLCPHAREPL